MEREYFDENEYKWSNPKTIVLAGASSTGKSTICFEIIRSRDKLLASEKRLKVHYHLPENHRIFVPKDIQDDEMVKFHEGLPNFNSHVEPCIIVLDDMASQIDESVLEAFTRHSHHRELTVILVIHNIFHPEKKSLFRTLSLNTGIFILTKNIRDASQVMTLARQIDPKRAKGIFEAYSEAVSRKFGYFVIDCGTTTNNKLRFRTNIFNTDPAPRNVVYYV